MIKDREGWGIDGRPRIHLRPAIPAPFVTWQIGPTGRPFLADNLAAAVTAATEHFDIRHGLVIFWEPSPIAPGAASSSSGA